MGHGEANGGWRVSQVERLLNMPRRDITRSCYADLKRGGAGILQPADGTWGRRNYSIEDIAWLYLVKLQHDQGTACPRSQKGWIRRPVSARCASIWTPWRIAPPRLMRRRSKGGSVRACCVVRWGCAHVRFTTHSSAICGTASVTRRLKSGEACCGSLCRPSLRTVIPPSSTPKRPIAYDGFSMNPEWTWQSSYGRGQVRSSVCAKLPSPGKKISNTPDREECWHD